MVEDRIPMQHANVQHGTIRVEETTTGVVPVAHGGLYYRVLNPPATTYGRLMTPSQLVADPNETPLLLWHALDPVTGIVTIRYRDTYAGSGSGPYVSEKTYAFRLVGRSLEITADSDFTVSSLAVYNHAGFMFDSGEGLPTAKQLRVPYMDNVPVFAGGNPPVFCTRMIDWYVSNASDNPSVLPSVSGSTFAGEVAS